MQLNQIQIGIIFKSSTILFGRMADKLILLVRAVILSTLYGSVIFFATSIFQCEMVKELKQLLS